MKAVEHDKLEKIYRDSPGDAIPWNRETPPPALVELVESGTVKPCKALDLGCGTGNYAIYLAQKGFEMTGVDFSASAIKRAKEKARKKGAGCRFLVADVVNGLDNLEETFDFAYDWTLLHHIYPEYRPQYVANVYRLLRPGGKYLSVCFSEDDPAFGGKGKYRLTSMGTTLYFSSEKELRELFEPHFTILKIKTIEIEGRTVPHRAVYVFMEKAG